MQHVVTKEVPGASIKVLLSTTSYLKVDLYVRTKEVSK